MEIDHLTKINMKQMDIKNGKKSKNQQKQRQKNSKNSTALEYEEL